MSVLHLIDSILLCSISIFLFPSGSFFPLVLWRRMEARERGSILLALAFRAANIPTTADFMLPRREITERGIERDAYNWLSGARRSGRC